MQVCPFILYPNAKRRTAGLDHEDTLDHSNESAKIVEKPDNPREFFVNLVADFTYHHDHQVTAFNKQDILEQQHWIGGIRQTSIPDPILNPDQIPEELKYRL